MILRPLFISLLVAVADAQDSSSASSSSTSSSSARVAAAVAVSISPVGSTITNPSVSVPTGTYNLITGTQYSLDTNLPTSTTVTGNNTTTTSNPLLIVGGTAVTTNRTVTATSSSATATNTQACNNYPEFCTRQYSNITEVGAHNSAFVRENNAFSNQQVRVLGQLNDGIRMIQGEVHHVNGSLWNCHSNCDYLNTGLYEDTLRTISRWLDANPYEVVTLLIVNSNYANVTTFAEPFQNSGILNHIYLPSRRPMRLQDWPTLGDMILSDSRAVVFMDYQADADLVPYILDEFSNMWETPYSPTDINFPCTQQRPPGLSTNAAKNNYLMTANHNLNVAIEFNSDKFLIPNFNDLALVNANNDSTGSLINMAENCTGMWGRPPNFLLVDFYDIGAPSAGSVFEVAAQMNNVTYNRACCGQNVGLSSGAVEMTRGSWGVWGAVGAAAVMVAAMV